MHACILSKGGIKLLKSIQWRKKKLQNLFLFFLVSIKEYYRTELVTSALDPEIINK